MLRHYNAKSGHDLSCFLYLGERASSEVCPYDGTRRGGDVGRSLDYARDDNGCEPGLSLVGSKQNGGEEGAGRLVVKADAHEGHGLDDAETVVEAPAK